jgi:hypothetical protein
MTAPDEPVVYCQRHAGVETVLRCGRCEAPICPRCMVHTPGGIRCPDCARLRRPVMYELSATDYLRAAGAAAAAALPIGFIGAIVLPPTPRAGIFLHAIAHFAGVGAGALIAEAMSRATRNKRGMAMQLIAVAAVVLAGALRLIFAGLDFSLAAQDVAGGFAVIVAAVSAWGRFR